ncbi:phage protein Gp36 family protein [Desulfohalovibrio reitneri]|uniref:phage protein Gp36 family protein n=1 Tax=Desulfohalovibrio reitneri TaxID=1307759 RepID=UPI0004A738D7|nr:phage protein Gp36 family protein [Desulfohalovibrio reitneri]
MSTYCTPDDMRTWLPENELIQLADDSLDGSGTWESVAEVLEDAIERGSAEVDGYLETVMELPLPTPLPGLVKSLAARLAVSALLLRRGALGPDWEAERARCLRTLERIADGRLRLGAEPAEQSAMPDTLIEVSTPARLWGDDTWRKF